MILKRSKTIKIENIFLVLATVFVLTFMVVQPINRVPDETNHARMTWEIFHKPTEKTYKWMENISSEPHVSQKEYKKLFTEKLDLSQEESTLGINLKTLSFLPQLIGMTLGSFIYPSVGVIIMMGRFFNGLAYILGVYFHENLIHENSFILRKFLKTQGAALPVKYRSSNAFLTLKCARFR